MAAVQPRITRLLGQARTTEAEREELAGLIRDRQQLNGRARRAGRRTESAGDQQFRRDPGCAAPGEAILACRCLHHEGRRAGTLGVRPAVNG